MNLLVDLDGTIADTGPSIIGSVRYALQSIGIIAPPAGELGFLIGPPLRQSLPQLGVRPDQYDAVIARYREKYASGAIFDAKVFDGVDDALRALRGQGYRLFVATSKLRDFAELLIAHFDLADVFEAVHGSELDGSNPAKKDVIASILRTHDIAAGDCVMIGDTLYDVEGARAHGIPTIGVAWGQGGESLAASNPAVIVHKAEELPAAVMRFAPRVA